MKGIAYYASPVGDLVVESVDNKITSVLFLKGAARGEEVPTEATQQCIQELDEYFYRGRKFFTVEVDPQGSEFQKKVWNALLEIPYGETTSYEAIAIRVGDIKSIRAVGLANGQNPVSIIIPCHRVIGKNGDLTGYGGGLENKEWLLYHEGAILRQLSLF